MMFHLAKLDPSSHSIWYSTIHLGSPMIWWKKIKRATINEFTVTI